MTSGLANHLNFADGADNDFTSLMAADRKLGNAVGFGQGLGGVTMLSDAQGAATNVYAAFEPSLKGLFPPSVAI